MRIIKRRERKENVHYGLCFNVKGTDGGFMFDCDKDGNVIANDRSHQNYKLCLAEAEKYDKPFVQTFRNSYSEPAVGECECGCEVVLHGFTNTCDKCNRDYNMSGQLLASRSQWGEETGESLADILNIP